MNILRNFRNGLMVGCTIEGAAADAGGGGVAAYVPAEGSFAAGLPEGLRANEAFKDVKDPHDLAARYVEARTFKVPEKFAKANPALNDLKNLDSVFERLTNAEKLTGADRGRIALIPKDDAKPEEVAAFYQQLGRPEKADGYKLPERPADKPYSDADKAFQAQVLPILHKANLTQPQLAALVPEWDNLVQTMATAHDASLAAGREKVNTDLRTAKGGDYDAFIASAGDAINHYSKELKLGDALTNELDANRLGNNPALAELLAHFGKQLKEDGLLGKHQGGHDGDVSPEAAKSKIKELEAAFRANDKFKDKKAPGRAEAMAEITRYYEIAYPGQQAPAA